MPGCHPSSPTRTENVSIVITHQPIRHSTFLRRRPLLSSATKHFLTTFSTMPCPPATSADRPDIRILRTIQLTTAASNTPSGARPPPHIHARHTMTKAPKPRSDASCNARERIRTSTYLRRPAPQAEICQSITRKSGWCISLWLPDRPITPPQRRNRHPEQPPRTHQSQAYRNQLFRLARLSSEQKNQLQQLARLTPSSALLMRRPPHSELRLGVQQPP